jgi:amino acid transporter
LRRSRFVSPEQEAEMASIDTPHIIPIRTSSDSSRKLGRGLLTALVIGSMVGSGVFSLPQNMSAKAGPLAVMIGWTITGVGMLAQARS